MKHVLELLERYRPEEWKRQKKDFPDMKPEAIVHFYYGRKEIDDLMREAQIEILMKLTNVVDELANKVLTKV